MKQLVEFPLEGGGSIVVEVEGAASSGGVVRGARPGEIVDQAKQSFEAALEKLVDVVAPKKARGPAPKATRATRSEMFS